MARYELVVIVPQATGSVASYAPVQGAAEDVTVVRDCSGSSDEMIVCSLSVDATIDAWSSVSSTVLKNG